jgi:glycosyltransferase involved in cell wall biosynthesis
MKTGNVTILMCCYNAESTVALSISSVLKQSFNNFQFIIIDDASTDTTLEILQSFEKEDKRISIYSNDKNIGLTRSLNRGLKYCSGTYIARIDADDIWHKDKLAKQIKYLEAHPNCALLGTAYQRIDVNGAYLGEATIAVFNSDNLIRNTITKFNPFFHSSVVFKRDACLQLGGYDESYRYAQDYNLWVRFIAKYSVANLPQILAFQRITQDNISFKKERQQRWYALKSKFLAIKLLKLSVLHYYYLLNEIAIIILPRSLVKLIRKLK